MRAVAFVLACAFAVSAPGAPVPKARDTVFYKEGWDRAIDPDRDCKFTVTREALTIEVPAKAHELYSNYNMTNAPRLMRDVTGDFTVEVRVTGPFHATRKSTLNDQAGYTAAGLLIDTGDRETGCYRFDFGMSWFQGPKVSVGSVRETKPGRSGSWGSEGPGYYSMLKGAKAAYLRIERKGDEIHPAVSMDGKKWHPQPWFELKYPGKVKVGLIVASTSKAKLKVTFDKFKLTTPEPRRAK